MFGHFLYPDLLYLQPVKELSFFMRVFLFILFTIFLTQVNYSQKEEENLLFDDRFLIEMGIFIPSQNLSLGADLNAPNEQIDWSETFNLRDNESTFFFHFEWRFSKDKTWKLSGEYFNINNGNSRVLEEDFTFVDFTFKAGSFVRVGIELDLFRLFIGKTVIAREKHLLGAGLGLHTMNIGAFAEGEILTSGGDKVFERRSVSAIIPLPNIGAWYYWGPHPKWFIGARVDWFGVSINEFEGSLWNIAPQVKFQFLRNFGVGLDYRLMFLGAKFSASRWQGKFNMDFTGPLITLHANF